jgi:hypothetical protein
MATGWDVSKKLEWIKEQAEWFFDLWMRLRPPRLQRYAGLVTLAGLGLLLMSFNDLLFELILERLGFNREGSLAPVIGVVLIVIGFLAMLGDKLVDRYPSSARLQDETLYNRIHSILPWDTLNHMLNNLHNHWYWSEDGDRIYELIHFMDTEENKFVDKQLFRASEKYLAALTGLRRHMSTVFFPPRGAAVVERYLMLPEISVEATGAYNENFSRAERTLNELVKSVDATFKKFAATGRNRGMVQARNLESPVTSAL